jgi:two-component system chemotaxis response regulator CheB
MMIRILLVDDSATETLILQKIFAPEKDFQIVGYAKNGHEAIKLSAELKPDLITMDIQMPLMDGIAAIHVIMAQTPTPIVVISSSANDRSQHISYDALEAGALCVLEKPINILNPNFAITRQRLIDTLRSMSEIKVIKRRFNTAKTLLPNIPYVAPPTKPSTFDVIAIGVSVGGPQALKTILEKLPVNFPLPILIVQHMTPGFITGFSNWLNEQVAIKVKTAEQGEVFKSGTVYFAPDGGHLEVLRQGVNLTANLVKGLPIAGFCPSINALLLSVAKTSHNHAIGILLTGMGHDGADGLLALKKAHSHTLIQDQESAVVFGMAGVAQKLGAVDKVVELTDFAEYLTRVTQKITSKLI